MDKNFICNIKKIKNPYLQNTQKINNMFINNLQSLPNIPQNFSTSSPRDEANVRAILKKLDNIKIPENSTNANSTIYQYISSLSTNSQHNNPRKNEYNRLKYICNEVLGDGTFNEVKLKTFEKRNKRAEFCKNQLLKISNEGNTDRYNKLLNKVTKYLVDLDSIVKKIIGKVASECKISEDLAKCMFLKFLDNFFGSKINGKQRILNLVGKLKDENNKNILTLITKYDEGGDSDRLKHEIIDKLDHKTFLPDPVLNVTTVTAPKTVAANPITRAIAIGKKKKNSKKKNKPKNKHNSKRKRK
tara:strand:+ start:713 stop:1615 length:903 start_codon:yes stop_codon:yes gene_type:complete